MVISTAGLNLVIGKIILAFDASMTARLPKQIGLLVLELKDRQDLRILEVKPEQDRLRSQLYCGA